MFKPLLFVIQMTFSPRIVEIKNYPPGNGYISHLCKRKNIFNSVLGRDMSLPPPKKKRTILETQTHLAGTGLVLRQFFEAVVDFNKNTPSKVHCSEPVLPSCLLPKKMFQRRYHYGCRFSRMSMEY